MRVNAWHSAAQVNAHSPVFLSTVNTWNQSCQFALEWLAGDQRLRKWKKGKEPIIKYPPIELGKLTGFRDPFVFERKTESSPWKMAIGSGVERQGGTILLYESQHLSRGGQLPAGLPTLKSILDCLPTAYQ